MWSTVPDFNFTIMDGCTNAFVIVSYLHVDSFSPVGASAQDQLISPDLIDFIDFLHGSCYGAYSGAAYHHHFLLWMKPSYWRSGRTSKDRFFSP